MYKEFKLFNTIFVLTKIGFKVINKSGDFGFKFFKSGISIYNGFSEKLYYWR